MACSKHLARSVYQFFMRNHSNWIFASHIVLLLLFISVVARYRTIVFHKRYAAKDTQSKRYRTITLVPYEVLLTFVLLCIPQLIWAGCLVRDAVAAGAWETRNFKSGWTWTFIAYFIVFDLLDRVQFKRRVLKRYYELKAKRSIVGLVADSVPEEAVKDKEATDQPADIEALNTPVSEKLSLRSRLRELLAVKIPEPMAINVLAQYHLNAFLKTFFVFVFLAQVSMIMRQGNLPVDKFFDMEASWIMPFGIVAAYMAVSFLSWFGHGIAFGRREVDFAALNAREGTIRL